LKTYVVYLKTVVTTALNVEADSIEEAIEKAELTVGHPNMQGTRFDAESEVDAYAVTDSDGASWEMNESGVWTLPGVVGEDR
jgi:hypothetical protein